jgi:pSer/pThr/pTyr-binding forkhead associated (FHA) protein
LDVARPGGQAGERLVLAQPFALIGRDPRNDLCLDADGISNRHVYLQVIAGRLFFLDLDSRIGCLRAQRDGTPCNPPHSWGWLEAEQVLRIEPFAVRLSLTEPGLAPADLSFGHAIRSLHDWSALETRTAYDPSSPRVVLEFTNDARVPGHCRLNRSLTLVGRLPGCKLQLPDASVSRYHCSLVHTAQGVWVVDLLSRQGTIVNGEPVRWAPLEDGASLRVGCYQIRLWFETPPPEDLVPGPARQVETTSCLPVAVPGPGPFLRMPAPRGAMQEGGLLLPIINQFNLMQQQLADQFHQTMLMMAQMFGRMHQEQTQLLREELDQVHRLTRELQGLQAEQLRHSAKPEIQSVPPETPAASVTAPAVASGQTENGQGARQEKSHAAPGEVSPAPSAPSPAPPLPPPQPGERRDANIHAWLSERIATLQEERRGHWQKILSFVLGK